MRVMPFFYVFDADSIGQTGVALTDGQTYNNLGYPTYTDSKFHLVRLAGLAQVASQIQWRDNIHRQRFSANTYLPYDYIFAPEMVYDPGSIFDFDLINVAKTGNVYGVLGSIPNYTSQLIMQGQRYFNDNLKLETQYDYRPVPFTYQLQVTVNWTGRTVASGYQMLDTYRRFILPINDYDFELYRIGITQRLNGSTATTNAYGTTKVMLYDNAKNQIATNPVMDWYLNHTCKNYNSVFPCPPMLYPAGSEIQMDVYSLLIASQIPAIITYNFEGMWRVPCGSPVTR